VELPCPLVWYGDFVFALNDVCLEKSSKAIGKETISSTRSRFLVISRRTFALSDPSTGKTLTLRRPTCCSSRTNEWAARCKRARLLELTLLVLLPTVTFSDSRSYAPQFQDAGSVAFWYLIDLRLVHLDLRKKPCSTILCKTLYDAFVPSSCRLHCSSAIYQRFPSSLRSVVLATRSSGWTCLMSKFRFAYESISRR
jgi:hypothetical protein